MWKIRLLGFYLFIGTSIYCYSQGIKAIAPQYTEVKIQNHEGMVDNVCFKWLGKSKCLQLLEEFEKLFSNVKNGYPEYYRSYFIFEPEPEKLRVTLIPKKLMMEAKRTKDIIPLNSKFLEVSYDLKTKKISKPTITGPQIIM